MSFAAGIVFPTNPDVSFVQGLARWISPAPQSESAPAAEAPAADAEGEGAAAEVEQPAFEPSAFENECIALESSGDFKQLSAKLGTALRERFATEPEQEVESAYTVLLQLLINWELLPQKVVELADELGGSVDERPLLRRTLLLSLYSIVQQYSLVDLRYPMLLKLIKYCNATNQLNALLGSPEEQNKRVEQWIRDWELTEPQKRELWGLVLDAHAEESTTVYENALKYLSLHEGCDLKAEPEVRARLVQSVLATLRSSDLLNCDKLAQLPIVQQLKGDAEFGILSELLDVFSRQMYADYLAFFGRAEVKAFMAKHGIDHETCERKMRLLSMVSLAQANKELTYASIASALRIGKDEVEMWVLEAIRNGLVEAKMDQIRELVVVSVCLERSFGTKQWARLKTSLSEWGDSVQGLLKVVLDSRPAPAIA